MKLFYAIVLILMVLVSACATVKQPPVVTTPTVEPEVQPEAEVPEAGAAVAVPVEEEKAPEAAAGNEVRILGKAGFEPMELTIAKGSAVTWINDDAKSLTLAIFKEGKFYMNSAVIKSGEQFEKEFSEAGSYEYWAIAYGVKAKITVE